MRVDGTRAASRRFVTNQPELCPPDCEAARTLEVPVPSGGEQSCRAVQELGLLFDISYTLESSIELRDVIRPVLTRMGEIMMLQRGAITVRDPDQGNAFITEAVGLAEGETKDDYLARCGEWIQQAIETGRPVVVSGMEQVPAFSPMEAGGRGFREVAFICVPIQFGNETVGSLSAERILEGAVDLAGDRRLLSLVGNLIAQTVHFHRLAQARIEELQRENQRLQQQIRSQFRPPNIIGASNAMRALFYHIEQVAGSNTTVLIRGESGVGKDLVARALHDQSPRYGNPFVKFNCAAMPESLIECELFGHEKGAFTGALAMRKGRFELGDGGTIFLDEIGDISPATQIRLLRVLQEKEFERVGGSVPIKTDVRIVAATSRNLEEMIEKGEFRTDLYYRLNVFPIYVPPLRERKSDIVLLTDYFIEKFSSAHGKGVSRISTAAIDLIMSYHWPGNVRELENCIERAVQMAPGKSIEANLLPPTLQKKDPAEKAPVSSLDAALSALEYEMLVGELKACDGNMSRAARNLGITERQMGMRVQKYHIDWRRFRS